MTKRRIETHEEIDRLKALLKESNLPYQDVQVRNAILLGYYDQNGHLIASGGLEFYGTSALLRSLAVEKNQRSQAIGGQMVDDLFQNARQNGIESIYLLTETAHDYFSKKGFSDIAREQVPEELKKSSEFSSVCPVSAACMIYDLQKS
jgi:amino-acid N-acetyltransferase